MSTQNRRHGNRSRRALLAVAAGSALVAAIASLVETCKLNGVDPQRYLADLLTRLVGGWPNSRLDELMPWCWTADAG